MNSLIIPVYRNEPNIPDLLQSLRQMHQRHKNEFEVVFVVDGSPDRSYALLQSALVHEKFRSQLIQHSRNFGSFAAIRTGLAEASGKYFGVMAADLQEPPELIDSFFEILQSGEADVVVGTRSNRDDPFFSQLASALFWWCYRKVINKDIPPGGVDIFGCNQKFKESLLQMEESNTSLIGLLFWLGFKRKSVSYSRRARVHGQSAWTLTKKLKYLSDSIFAFSDLPIKILLLFGVLGLLASITVAILVLVAKLTGSISVPGYAATSLLITFFAALNSLGFGLVGTYVWRVFENTKKRPFAVIMGKEQFKGMV
jgi:glycosyltransferase involved in cell wall biosynthesis